MKSGYGVSSYIISTTPHFEGVESSCNKKRRSSEFVCFFISPPKKHTEVTVSSVAAESDPEPCHQYPPRAFARCGKECKRWPEVVGRRWIGG